MSSKKILIATILAAWTISMAWLIRYEAFPEYFTESMGGYKEMFSGEILMSDTWMKIMFNETPIGYSHSSIEENDNDPLFHYLAKNEISLKLKLMNSDHDIEVKTAAALDMMHSLQKFTFSLGSKPSDSNIKQSNLMTITAIRKKEDMFATAIITPNNSERMLVEIPADVIIYSPMTDIALKKLRPGQEMTIKTFDPSTLATTFINIHAVRKESIIINNQTYDATLLSSDYNGAAILSWIDRDGTVLRQQTPFGWTMELCSPEEAMNASLATHSEDMLKGLSVPCMGKITNPLSSTKLRLQLTGVHFTKSELESFRQHVEIITADETTITTLGSTNTTQTALLPLTPEETNRLLQSTSFVQADHTEIMALAAKITKGKTDPLDKARAIFEWVYKNVEKEMTISMPSALDVLRTMKGDCNEHTYLFVALARAAGIPSKIKVGLAYHEGSFYYHAWPAVFVGQWVEMDPTWGQKYVDATHIAFVEGELADQVQIIKLLGQLKIKILEQSDHKP